MGYEIKDIKQYGKYLKVLADNGFAPDSDVVKEFKERIDYIIRRNGAESVAHW